MIKLIRALSFAGLIAAGIPSVSPAAELPWMDGTVSPDARADLLEQTITQEEKVRLLHGSMPITFPKATDRLPRPVIPGWDVPRPKYPGGPETPFAVHDTEGANVGYRWYRAFRVCGARRQHHQAVARNDASIREMR